MSSPVVPADPLWKRWAKRAAIATAALLTLWLVAWLAVPPLAKWQVESRLTDALGRRVSIGRVGFSPVRVLEETPEGLWVAGLRGPARVITVATSACQGRITASGVRARMLPGHDVVRAARRDGGDALGPGATGSERPFGIGQLVLSLRVLEHRVKTVTYSTLCTAVSSAHRRSIAAAVYRQFRAPFPWLPESAAQHGCRTI